MAIVIPYKPRPQFEAYHNRTERFAKIVAHRRFGKTVGCINDKIRAALTNTRQYPPPRYSYVAPTYTQAKDIAWGYLKHYSAPIPGIKTSESELWVEYPNGARIRLYGADNYDRMRGLYNDGVTMDEPAQIDPRAWPEVIRPTLADHQGSATFIGTPRGKDWFYKIDKAEDGTLLPGFFRLTLKSSATGIIPPAELESLRAGMSEDQFNREMECSFDAAIEGAYYARHLAQAKSEGRIGRVAFDPLMRVRVFCDLGGTGMKADAFAAWPSQFIAREIRVRDYYEAQGQPLATHVHWLHSKGYTPDRADIYLPHDGATNDRVIDVSFESAFRSAGYSVTTIPNQGKGAARIRIEAARRVFPMIWFDEASTEAGREALGWYHEKKSEDDRQIGLGPEHDWASHGADGFGLMCCSYEDPARSAGFGRSIKYPEMGYV